MSSRDRDTYISPDEVAISARWTIPESFAKRNLGTRLLYLILREEGAATVRGLSERLNINETSIQKRLQTLRKDGVVERRHFITQPGLHFYVLAEEYRPDERPTPGPSEPSAWARID